MPDSLLLLMLLLASLNWLAVARKIKTLEYVTKPGAMLALLTWFGMRGGFSGHALWFGIGLFFALCGDILLMLPQGLFIPGLVAFLLGHVAYLVGFNPTLPELNLPGALLAVMIGLTVTRVYRGIAAGLHRSGQDNLRGPVLAYIIVIALMLLSALHTLVRPEWDAGAALLASLGALLFFFSDAILAWDRFVVPLKGSPMIVMMTYHLGQFLLAFAAIRHFLVP